MPKNYPDKADQETLPVAVHFRRGEGIDSLTYLEGLDTYRVHLGGGLAAAEQARGELAVLIPGELVERAAWMVALALEHRDHRAAA